MNHFLFDKALTRKRRCFCQTFVRKPAFLLQNRISDQRNVLEL